MFRGVKKRFYFKNAIWFDLDIEDWIQENLFFLGEYEAPELNLLQRFLKKGDVFIDIGANIGLYTLYASKIVGKDGNVFSFEPFTESFNLLKHNVSLNHHTNIVLEKLAISKTQEEVIIHYNVKEANKGMASSYIKDFTYSETVNATSLDLYLKNHSVNKVDFIKIDIEGGEYPALLGMQETLKKFGPGIFIEIKEDILSQTPYSKKSILDFFYKNGYIIYNWGSEHEAITQTGDNFLFLKNKVC